MKSKLSLIVTVFILIALILLLVLLDFELGKRDHLQEAMEKETPYKVNDIIHTEQYDNVTIVMYQIEPNHDEFPANHFEAIAIAFFKGSDQLDWENIGYHGWTHYENDNMTVNHEPLRKYDHKGNKLHAFFVVFGEVNNPEITKVEVKTKEEESFKEAEIIRHRGNRYYFQIFYDVGKNSILVRGLSEKGNVIDLQGA